MSDRFAQSLVKTYTSTTLAKRYFSDSLGDIREEKIKENIQKVVARFLTQKVKFNGISALSDLRKYEDFSNELLIWP